MVFHFDPHPSHEDDLGYPLVNIQKAIENGPVEIVDFPINSMVIFHCYVSSPEGIQNSFLEF